MTALVLFVLIGAAVLAWYLHRDLQYAQGYTIEMTWYHEPDGLPFDYPRWPPPPDPSLIGYLRSLPADWEVKIKYEHEPARESEQP